MPQSLYIFAILRIYWFNSILALYLVFPDLTKYPSKENPECMHYIKRKQWLKGAKLVCGTLQLPPHENGTKAIFGVV
jgi:hypothetical protein